MESASPASAAPDALAALEEALAVIPDAPPSTLHLRLATTVDAAAVARHPRAHLLLALRSKQSLVARVMELLAASEDALARCMDVARTIDVAPGALANGLSAKLLLRKCLSRCAEASPPPAACVAMARTVVCALCRRLSLDAGASRPALELLYDGLELRTRRSGIVFLEPLRRLALLAAAASPEPSAPWPEPLLACVQTVAATDASAPEFAPIAPADVRAVLGEVRCCDAAAAAALEALLTDRLRHLLAPPHAADAASAYPWAPLDGFLAGADATRAVAQQQEEAMLAGGHAPPASSSASASGSCGGGRPLARKAWTFSTTSCDDITSQIPSHAITANSSSACRATVITCESREQVKH